MILTLQDLKTIRANKPLLIRAAEACGIPWQALAAVWYRESSLRETENAFQFDPVPARSVVFGLLQSYCGSLSISEKAAVMAGGVNEFYTCAIIAGCWLHHQSKYSLSVDHSEQAIADAFYGYNGRAYGSDPLNSPYVANELDDHHHDMHFRGTINGQWEDLIDRRPGALTVYRYLLSCGG